MGAGGCVLGGGPMSSVHTRVRVSMHSPSREIYLNVFVRFIYSFSHSGLPPFSTPLLRPPLVPGIEDGSLCRALEGDYRKHCTSGAHGRHHTPHSRRRIETLHAAEGIVDIIFPTRGT